MPYPHLFSPIRINGMVARNRIVAAPISDDFADKALGGAGIVICGHTLVEPGRSSFASPSEQSIFHKYSVEEARSRIRRCHAGGARASIELFHAGQYARVADYAVGPMSFIREDGTEVRALDADGIARIAGLFADAARDAKDLGFDMVFMHFGHGWLPAEFLSPLFNHRTDEFGGSLENRMKVPLLILQRVREAVGPDFPVDMRVSAVEWVPGSIEFADTVEFVKRAQQYIDTVQISAGLDINHEGNVHMVTTGFEPHMVNREFARQVRRAVDIPVSVVGAVMGPDEAEDLIASGDVDLVAFGRSFIADPDWPNKAKDGRADDIVPCIRCLLCYHISTNRRNVGCSVNPRYRNESFIPKTVTPAEHPRRVVVIGGGPAGITAALIASRRGHAVTLLEKADHLGGALHYVAKEHYKEDIAHYLRYLLTQMAASDVDVRLGFDATPDAVRALAPSALVLALGAVPATLPVAGADKPHVVGFLDAIEHPERLGRRVAVIGGGSVGSELALGLAAIDGHEVHLVEVTDTLAVQGNMLYRIALRQKMEATGNLHVHLGTTCEAIVDDGVELLNDGRIDSVPVDSVVIAIGVVPRKEAAQAFYGITPETYMIGDCDRARSIMEAVTEGHSTALNI